MRRGKSTYCKLTEQVLGDGEWRKQGRLLVPDRPQSVIFKIHGKSVHNFRRSDARPLKGTPQLFRTDVSSRSSGGAKTQHYPGFASLRIAAAREASAFKTAVSAPPAEREASGSPLEGGGIRLSSIKIRNTKHEIRNKFK